MIDQGLRAGLVSRHAVDRGLFGGRGVRSTIGSVRSLAELVERNAEIDPGRVAFRLLSGGSLRPEAQTLGQLSLDARSVAGALRSRGPASRPVLLITGDVATHVTCLTGVWYAGRVGVSGIPPQAPRRNPSGRHEFRLKRLIDVLENSDAKTILAPDAIIQSFRRGAADALQGRDLDWLPLEHALAQSAGPADFAAQINEQSLALIQYTSGSTGKVKGVAITHGNLVDNCRAHAEAMTCSADDVGVTWLPPHHDMGLIGTALMPLYAGFTCNVMTAGQFVEDPLRWLRAISELRGTVSCAPNFAYEACAARAAGLEDGSLDLSSWRRAGNGSEPIRVDTLSRFEQVFRRFGFSPEAYCCAYGLAEATLFVSARTKSELPLSLPFSREGLAIGKAELALAGHSLELANCGEPSPHLTLAIVDPDERMILPDGSVGEIWCQGPSVAAAYVGDAEATAEYLKASLQSGEGPFLRTGDLGFIQDGCLYVSGRLKDLIVLRGVNYYPHDVEAISAAASVHLDAQACVAFAFEEGAESRLGVVAEIDRHGEELGVELIPAIRGALAGELGVTVDAIWLVRRGTIPKTPSGKLQRRQCGAAIRAGDLQAIHTWMREEANELAGRVLAIDPEYKPSSASELCGILLSLFANGSHQVSKNSRVADLGLTSLDVVEFGLALRQRFQVEIKLSELQEASTVGTIAEAIWRHWNTSPEIDPIGWSGTTPFKQVGGGKLTRLLRLRTRGAPVD